PPPAQLYTLSLHDALPICVLHRLLAPKLGVLRPDVGDVAALVVGGHLERRPGARGGLLEDQRDAPAGQAARPPSRPLVRPQPPAEVDEIEKLFGAEVDFFEQAAPAQVHGCSLVLVGQAALLDPMIKDARGAAMLSTHPGSQASLRSIKSRRNQGRRVPGVAGSAGGQYR